MDEAIKIKFESLEAENTRQNHRLTKLEENVKEIQKLTLSVQKLADSMERMVKEQTKQGEKLEKLESKPGEAWSSMTRTIFNTALGAVIGVAAVALMNAIINFM